MEALLAVVILSVVAVAAYEGMSVGVAGNGTNTKSPSSEVTTSSSAQPGEEIFIQVVNASTMAPIAGMSVVAGPDSVAERRLQHPGRPHPGSMR